MAEWVAALAAPISAVSAAVAFWYAHTVRRPSLAGMVPTVSIELKPGNGVRVHITFGFKNMGQVTARIRDVKLQRVRVWPQQGIAPMSVKLAVNEVHADIRYDVRYSFDENHGGAIRHSDEVLIPERVTRGLGIWLFALRIDYRGDSIFTRRHKTARLFYSWHGESQLRITTDEEYRENQAAISKEMRRDD